MPFSSRGDFESTAPDTGAGLFTQTDITAELDVRQARSRDHAAVDRALATLAAEMAEHPRSMLQTLARLAAELCHADAAGVSLLDGDVFRWEALAGSFIPYTGGTMPRHASPCGVVIDVNATRLMRLPHLAFPALTVQPVITEALLVPFHAKGTPVGTVWVVAQSPERNFDREDERVIRTLAQFAAAGWQLWMATAAAEESSRRKDDFLATLGHELRNPLAALAAAVGTLEKTAGRAPGTRTLAVLRRQTQHMFRLVDDMLDLARTGAGKLRLDVSRIEFCRAVIDTVDERRAQFEARRQRLLLDVPANPLWIDADAGRLGQIVANLLDNAQKFTPDGGRVSVSVASTPQHATLQVRDSGVGIPAHRLESIFDHFAHFDGHPSQSRGLGLGLALARRLAELSGGRLTASSDGPEQGSCFVLRLPLAGAGAAEH